MRRSAACAAVLGIAVTGCGGGASGGNDGNATAAAARKCLAEKGARVSGDPGRRPPADDRDAPDRELVAALGSTGAFIAFYTTEARAKALEPGIRKNAARFHGEVVRNRNTTVVYTKKPSDDVRKRIEGCLF